MKYPIKIYAKALAESLIGKKEDGQKKILNNFVALVERNRDESKLKKILEKAQNIYLKKTGKNRISIEFARENEKHLKLLKTFIKEGDVLEEKINPDLIAGVKIILNGEKQFDYSLSKKILCLMK